MNNSKLSNLMEMHTNAIQVVGEMQVLTYKMDLTAEIVALLRGRGEDPSSELRSFTQANTQAKKEYEAAEVKYINLMTNNK